MSEPEYCIRCGEELDAASEIALQTGICPECWKPEDEDDES